MNRKLRKVLTFVLTFCFMLTSIPSLALNEEIEINVGDLDGDTSGGLLPFGSFEASAGYTVNRKFNFVNSSVELGDWTCASNDKAYLTTTSSSLTVTNSAAHSGQQSLLIENLYYAPKTALPVEKGKEYYLSFWWKAKSFRNNAVKKDESVNNNAQLLVYLTNADATVREAQSSNIAACTVAATVKSGAYEWQQFVTGFTVPQDFAGKYYYIMFPCNGSGNVGDFYMDDFYMEQIIDKEDSSTPVVTENVSAYFKTPENWQVNGADSTNIGAYPGAATSAATVTKATGREKTYLGEEALQLNGNGDYYSVLLPNMKPNTDYVLTLSYKAPALESGKDYAVESAAVFVPTRSKAALGRNNFGSLSYVDSNLNYRTEVGFFTTSEQKFTTAGAKAGNWCSLMLRFNSKTFKTIALVLKITCNELYVDNINLKEETAAPEFNAANLPEFTGGTANAANPTYTEKAKVLVYNNTTPADFENYFTALTAAGFTKLSENTIAQNRYAAFAKGEVLVNVNYTAYDKTVKIAASQADTLPTTPEQNVYTNKGVEPLLVQLNTLGKGDVPGMGYLLRLADGSFIVIDGGYNAGAGKQAEFLYQAMKQYSVDGNIHITAWILTHLHRDHIDGFTDFVLKYSGFNDVKMDEVIFAGTSNDDYSAMVENGRFKDILNVKELKGAIGGLLPNTRVSTPHSGDEYYLKNARLEILSTVVDLKPTSVNQTWDFNNSSTTFNIYLGGQKILFTGDASTTMLKYIVNNFGADLHCDIYQLPHHGINPTQISTVQAPVVLLPAETNTYNRKEIQQIFAEALNAETTKEAIVACYGNRALALPYTPPEGLSNKISQPLPNEIAKTYFTHGGVSLRKQTEEKPQALRFKFTVEKANLSTCFAGYFLTEYGCLVLKENSLAGAELTFTESGKINGKRYATGVAYNKEQNVNVAFEEDEQSVTFAAALYNIGVFENGSVDYNIYKSNFCVRPYAVFKNAKGEEIVCYGETEKASLFSVYHAILNPDSSVDTTTEQYLADKAYVTQMLQNAEIKLAYDAWKEN